MSNNDNASKITNILNSKAFAITKKVLWGVIYGIFAIVIIAVAWLAIDKFILGSTVPSVLGYATLTVETGSMESELQIGDLILIKDTGDYKIGDIVTYMHEGDKIPTTHRIINYTEGGFITKGDANNVKDTDIVPSDIVIGEVVKVFPKVGLFAKWVKVDGWMYIVAILVIIALGSLIVKVEGTPDGEKTEDNSESKEENQQNSKEENNEPEAENEPSDNKDIE